MLQGPDGAHLSPDTLALLQPDGVDEGEASPTPGPSRTRPPSGAAAADGPEDAPRGTLTGQPPRPRSRSCPPPGEPAESDSEQEDTPGRKKRKRRRTPASPGRGRRVRFRPTRVTVRDSQDSEDEDPALSDPLLGRLSPQHQRHQPRDEAERRSTQRGRPPRGGQTDAVETQKESPGIPRLNALRVLRRRRRHRTEDLDREIRKAKGPYDARFAAWAWKEILDGNITLEGQAPAQAEESDAAPTAAAAEPPAPSNQEAQHPNPGGLAPTPSHPNEEREPETLGRPDTPPTPPPLPVRRRNPHLGARRPARRREMAGKEGGGRTRDPDCGPGYSPPADTTADGCWPADLPISSILPPNRPRLSAREEGEEAQRRLALIAQRTRRALGGKEPQQRQQAHRNSHPIPLWKRWRAQATRFFYNKNFQHAREPRHLPRDRRATAQRLHLPAATDIVCRLPLQLAGSRAGPAGGTHGHPNTKSLLPPTGRHRERRPYHPAAPGGQGAVSPRRAGGRQGQ